MESIIAQHYSDLIKVMFWLITSIGGLLIFTLGWIGKMVISRLGNIEGELGKTNDTLSKIETDIRGELSQLDRRIAVVETRCQINHGKGETG